MTKYKDTYGIEHSRDSIKSSHYNWGLWVEGWPGS